MKSPIILLVTLAAALVAGCKLEVPTFESASVEVHTNGRVSAAGVLAPSQVEALSDWLRSRPTGWEHRLEDTAPALLVKLEGRGRIVAVMNIMEHQVKIGDLFRPITSEERHMLQLLLTPLLNAGDGGQPRALNSQTTPAPRHHT